MSETQIKKIMYRAIHRGCKETDFLLGNFFIANKDNLPEFGLDLCENFLQEDDLLIYDWILNENLQLEKYKNILNAIRNFHNL